MSTLLPCAACCHAVLLHAFLTLPFSLDQYNWLVPEQSCSLCSQHTAQSGCRYSLQSFARSMGGRHFPKTSHWRCPPTSKHVMVWEMPWTQSRDAGKGKSDEALWLLEVTWLRLGHRSSNAYQVKIILMLAMASAPFLRSDSANQKVKDFSLSFIPSRELQTTVPISKAADV